MPEKHPGSARLLRTAAGLILAVAVVGCSGDDSDSGSTIVPVAAAVNPTTSAVVATAPTTALSTTTLATAAPTVAAPPPTTAAPPTTLPDGPTVLQQSFDQIAAGYHFLTTATVNGSPALTVEGDHIGDSTRMAITSQGKTVDYIVLPDQTWVSDSGDWQELDEPAPAGDPISALRSPQSVTVTGYTPQLTTLAATYPASALALPGDQPVTVAFELAGLVLQAISYGAPDGTSSVRADISALADTTPITSPSVGG